jgi:hypothetical protein
MGEEMEIDIYNSPGQLIDESTFERRFETSVQIDFTGNGADLYTIHILSGTCRSIIKVIKR